MSVGCASPPGWNGLDATEVRDAVRVAARPDHWLASQSDLVGFQTSAWARIYTDVDDPQAGSLVCKRMAKHVRGIVVDIVNCYVLRARKACEVSTFSAHGLSVT